MGLLRIEKIGGIAGFGGSRLRSRGEVNSDALSAADRTAVDALFQGGHAKSSATRDGFRFRISRATPAGDQMIEVSEPLVPAALTNCVKDELV